MEFLIRSLLKTVMPPANAVRAGKGPILALPGTGILTKVASSLIAKNGRFIEGYYLVGLFFGLLTSQEASRCQDPLDPRFDLNTEDILPVEGAILSAARAACLHQGMYASGTCSYGGEMSAHHYFADFSYCDSGDDSLAFVISSHVDIRP